MLWEIRASSPTCTRGFPSAPAELFPSVSNCLATHQLTSAGPTSSCDVGSVHNAYIQVAAEEGVIGLLALVVVAVGIRRRVRKVRAQTTDPAIRAALRWACLVLVVVLIWWNDNPLFGGQAETLLAALALGTLAVPWSALGWALGKASAKSGREACAPFEGCP